MNRERAKELLPIIQAFADGETIQFRHDGGVDWLDSDERFNPLWHDDYEYRIKPERRKVWVHFPHDETPELGLMPPENGVCPRPNCKVVCVEEPES